MQNASHLRTPSHRFYTSNAAGDLDLQSALVCTGPTLASLLKSRTSRFAVPQEESLS